MDLFFLSMFSRNIRYDYKYCFHNYFSMKTTKIFIIYQFINIVLINEIGQVAMQLEHIFFCLLYKKRIEFCLKKRASSSTAVIKFAHPGRNIFEYKNCSL